MKLLMAFVCLFAVQIAGASNLLKLETGHIYELTDQSQASELFENAERSKSDRSCDNGDEFEVRELTATRYSLNIGNCERVCSSGETKCFIRIQ